MVGPWVEGGHNFLNVYRMNCFTYNLMLISKKLRDSWNQIAAASFGSLAMTGGAG